MASSNAAAPADPAAAAHSVPADPDFDPFADDVLRDSQAYFDRLREYSPVVHLPRRELWAVTRYEHLREVLADPDTFSSAAVAFNDRANRVMAGTTIATDPPDHQRLRAALMENLIPRALRSQREGIEARADEIVRGLLRRGSFDGLRDLAKPFVLSVVMDLVGVQGEVRHDLLRWGEAALNMQGPLNERAVQAFPVTGELFDWTRRRLRAEDLTEGSLGRGVFDAGARGDVPPESCPILIEQLVIAGMDTTITALGNAVLLFARFPEQFQRLRESPKLVASAFAEVQRFCTPLPILGRRATRDVEIGGVRIPAGAQVALLLAAGNRDPRHFEAPDTFDVTRNPTDHLSFGYGTHGCAGQGLARMEAHAMIGALAAQVGSLTVTHAERRLNNITRPWEDIEVIAAPPG